LPPCLWISICELFVAFGDVLHRPRGWFSEADNCLFEKKGQKVRVDLVLVCSREAVWRAWIVEFFRALDDFRGLVSRITDRNNLIVLTMQDQRRNIKLLEIVSEIGFGERFDRLISVLQARLHTPQPELIKQDLRNIGSSTISAVKLNCQIFIEL